MGWTAPPPGYEILELKHQDGGFLVMDERKVVHGCRPTLAPATSLAWESYKSRKGFGEIRLP
jgi:hypothetical protein